MKAEIINIGTELLIGSILNTNAKFLAEKCAENAIDLYHQSSVGDNLDRMAEALSIASSRSDLIILSGGLGPTKDDVTVEGLSRFLSQPRVLHKPTEDHIKALLRKRRIPFTKSIRSQCFLPKDCIVFTNHHGTAPGILCKISNNKKPLAILALPGPPQELEPLFINQALPYIQKKLCRQKEYFVVRSVKMAGSAESQVADKVKDLLELKPPVTVGIYAKPGEVELKIMSKGAARLKAELGARRIESMIKKRLHKHIYAIGSETLPEAVGKLLLKKKKTIAIAESCSGGLLSHLITDCPGSSAYFVGSIVAYHDSIKTRVLGVEAHTIKNYGAVSAPTAIQMAKGIKKNFHSDYGIAITGIAGPGGATAAKPVGLVYIAIAGEKKTIYKKCLLGGSRSRIKQRAAIAALDLLRRL